MIKYFFVAMACCIAQALAAQPSDWQSKIDPAVSQAIADGGTTDFLVRLSENADLSGAVFLVKKAEKGAFVRKKLVETAERTQANVRQLLEAWQAPNRPFWIVNCVWAEGGSELVEALAKLPEVASVQPNPRVKFQEPTVDRDAAGGIRAIEWNVTHINADDVWAMGFDGTGIVVGGQDTGYEWDHPALKSQYRGWNSTTMTADHNYNWHDAIDANIPPNTGTNPCGYSLTVPCDDHNHGTHTMGTMTGDDGGSNQIGVAPGAKWIGCRNMERGWGMPSTYLECFEWFEEPTDLNGQNPNTGLAPHVINNSWGCPTVEGCNSSNFATMNAAVESLRAAGVVVVVSAGNSGSNCSTVTDPAAIFEGSFSVGASDVNNAIAGFSSRGPVTVDGSNRLKPNVSAPGVNIRSCVRGGGYQSGWNGTSMAGPHVAAVVALMLDANPSLEGQVAIIETLLESSAIGMTSTQNCGSIPGTNIPNNTFGYGVLDALLAVNAALALVPIELVDFRGKIAGTGVQLDWEIEPNGSLNHFEVEHAGKNLQWEVIGKLAFDPQVQDYSVLDGSPILGDNFYRLKMVDIDGSVKYSKVIVVSLAPNGTLATYPNPVGDELSLAADWQTDSSLAIRIMDASGRVLARFVRTVGNTSEVVMLDIADLPSGLYTVEVVPDGGGAVPTFYSKFVKK